MSALPYHLASFAVYLLIINLIGYSAFYMDKRLAQRRDRRISESSLLLIALLGGTLGSITAQHQFRHKTKKRPFKFQLYMIAGLQGLCLLAGLHPDICEHLLFATNTF